MEENIIKINYKNLVVFNLTNLFNKNATHCILKPILNTKKVYDFLIEEKPDFVNAHIRVLVSEFFKIAPNYYSQFKTFAYDFFVIIEFNKLQKLIKNSEYNLDSKYLVTLDMLKNKKNIFIDKWTINQKELLSSVDEFLDTKDIANILSTFDKNKFVIAKPLTNKIKVSPEKFNKHIMQHIGFGSSNYFEFNNKKIILDFGGDLSVYPLDAMKNYVILTHWHIDHFRAWKKLPIIKNGTFIVGTRMISWHEWTVFHSILNNFKTIVLFFEMEDYWTNPHYVIGNSIFIYPSPFVDSVDLDDSRQNFVDLNTVSLVTIHVISETEINVYPGDQVYAVVEKILNSFYKNIMKFERINLLHATHHGLLASTHEKPHEKLQLKINSKELKIYQAFISNNFGRFKENVLHKDFLDNNSLNPSVATLKNDIESWYENGILKFKNNN